MTKARPRPGDARVDGDQLVSANPVSGEEIARFRISDSGDVARAVAVARAAQPWWQSLGYARRRTVLLRWAALLARKLPDFARLLHVEGGKPMAEAAMEIGGAIDQVGWAARHGRRVLGPRRVRSTIFLLEYATHLEYQPYGVVGVIAPWNYPVFTPLGALAPALIAGNAVVLKPSEYTPAAGQFLADTFSQVTGGAPVFGIVHGLGETGAALCSSGVDKIAFTGSTATGRKVMAACAGRLTPLVLECGSKDAMIVDADADPGAAAAACVFGGMTNAGQTCIGTERVYVHEDIYDAFLRELVQRAARLKVGTEPDSDIGPITMPGQLDVIREHIADALAHGGRAVLGGLEEIEPPFVRPTILVEVGEDSRAVQEETFGPVLVVRKVPTMEEALALANALPYGLGGTVFSQRNGLDLARRMRSGMTAVNSVMSYAAMSSVPFGGVGASGFGRLHGDDGLREFAWAKTITRRRAPSPLPLLAFPRGPRFTEQVQKLLRIVYR
ncbi:aldehyde dehydrogenase family protein [Longispora albida]|uniref:aldehyde dehydrogenase family protein n=1 Tax=Longispora albida TaxID=203523 RepID=UPI00035D54F3|nr:aldehyde dehydrogenase family protein [Longispora albida]